MSATCSAFALAAARASLTFLALSALAFLRSFEAVVLAFSLSALAFSLSALAFSLSALAFSLSASAFSLSASAFSFSAAFLPLVDSLPEVFGFCRARAGFGLECSEGASTAREVAAREAREREARGRSP